MSNQLKNEKITKSSLPWHGWILGGIFLLYSLAAAFDSAMGFIQGDAYYQRMTEMQVAFFSNIPFLVDAGITICIWGGLLASISLLMRKPISATLFLIATVSNIPFLIYAYLLADGIPAMGVLWLAPIIITSLMAAMIFYCRGVTKVHAVSSRRTI